MTPETLKILEHKFLDYADRYISQSPNLSPLVLKKEHTIRVCGEIESLVKDIMQDSSFSYLSDPSEQNFSLSNFSSVNSQRPDLLARAMALFHDIGRFRQFQTYKTFLDHKSANHAGLSIIEIDAHNMLSICSERERELIKGAIAVHNAAVIPQIEDKELTFFMRLLRDADKLDIWRVVIDNYLSPDPESKDAINLGLQDYGKCSSEALQSILNHTYVKINSVKELNDLKLMQISWVFDLNFSNSIRRVKERGYAAQLISTLSIQKKSDELNNAIKCVHEYIKKNS
ncbi:MAG: hypothetical protein AB7U45_03260 [Desulfamplus sp.]